MKETIIIVQFKCKSNLLLRSVESDLVPRNLICRFHLILLSTILPVILAGCYFPLDLSSTQRMDSAMAVANDKIFFAGGTVGRETPSSLVDILDTITNTWSIITLPAPRMDISAASVGSTVIFFGGRNGTDPYPKADLYDLNTQTLRTIDFSSKNSRWTSVANFKSIVIGSKAYFYGWQAPLLIFNPAENSVEIIPRSELVSASTNGTHIYFLRSISDNIVTEVFNVDTHVFTRLPDIQWPGGAREIVIMGSEKIFSNGYTLLAINPFSRYEIQFADWISSPTIYWPSFVLVGDQLIIIGDGFIGVYLGNGKFTRYSSNARFFDASRAVHHNGVIYSTGTTSVPNMHSVLVTELASLSQSPMNFDQYNTEWMAAANGYVFASVPNGIGYYHLPTNRYQIHSTPKRKPLANAYNCGKIGNELIVIDGDNNLYDTFNFKTEKWSTHRLPLSFSASQDAISDNTTLIFINEANLYIFNSLSREWSYATGSDISKRIFRKVIVVREKIVLITLVGIEVYEIATNSWKKYALEMDKDTISANSVSGSLIFVAGRPIGNDSTNLYIYDVNTESIREDKINIGRRNPQSIAFEEFVIFAGGEGTNSQRVSIYNVKSNTWNFVDLPATRTPRTPPLLEIAARDKIVYFMQFGRIDTLDLRTFVFTPLIAPVGQPMSIHVIGSKVMFRSETRQRLVTIYETTTQETLDIDIHGHTYADRFVVTENYVYLGQFRFFELTTMQNLLSDSQLFVGFSTNFSVAAQGRNLLTHWQHNGIQLANENQPTLQLNNVTEQSTGTYTINMVDRCNQVMRQQAMLTVFGPPKFISPLEESIVMCQEEATLQTEVDGRQMSFNWTIGEIMSTTLKPVMTINGSSLECNSRHSFCVTAINPSGSRSSCSSLRLVSHDSVFDGPRPTVHQSTWFSESRVSLKVRLLDDDCTEHKWLMNGGDMGVNGTDASTIEVEISPLIKTQSFTVIAMCGNSVLTSHPFQFDNVSSLTVAGVVWIVIGCFILVAGLALTAFLVRRRINSAQAHESELQSLLTQAKSNELKKDGVSIIQTTTWEWKPSDDFTYQLIDNLPFTIDTSSLKIASKNAVDVNLWVQNEITFASSKSHKDRKLYERLLAGTHIDIYVPQSPKYEIKVEPSSFTLEEGVPVPVTVSSKMRMTTKCKICLVIVCEQKKIYSVLEYKLESKTSMWIDLDEVETTGDYLGGGGFGSVTRGVYRSQEVAVKKLLMQLDEGSLQEFEQEVTLMKNLHHPNIVQFIGASNVKNNLAIIIEYAPLGSLASVMKKHRLSFLLKATMLLETAKALQFLHANAIIHRDIKPQNILVFSLEPRAPVHVKLTDFGTARFISNDPTTITKNTGTFVYMAPEALGKTPKITTSADVHSFAILMWEVVTEMPPFSEFEWQSDIELHLKAGKRLDFPPMTESEYPLSMVKLIEECWHAEPEKRPTMTAIVQQLSAMLL